ncbi:MAG: hypothetical protein QOI96_1908, partial [Verrucomicrobiota bacterium]
QFAQEVFRTKYLLRDWKAAAQAGKRLLVLAPDSPTVLIEESLVDLWSKGDLTRLRAFLATIPAGVDPDGEVTVARWDAALVARDFSAAERAVADCTSETVTIVFDTPLSKGYLLGCIALAQGEPARARPLFETARAGVEAETLAVPLDPFRHAQLGLLYAYLGRKADALREGYRAIEILPESKDAFSGPRVAGLLALIFARTGELDQSITLIERLLTTPAAVDGEGSITLSELRLRWQWDPLRENPRFQKLLAGPEPKTVYK